MGTRAKNSFQPFNTIRYNNILVEVSEQFIFSFFKIKIQCEIGSYGSMVKGVTKNQQDDQNM